jgi:predicted MFS family arabinose efflux permease
VTRTLHRAIVAMSALAVLSDTVLIAFYPQFFAARYGVDGALHAGLYVGAISLVVMVSFPLWARLARRVETLPLLVCTQGAAGLLCTLCAVAPGALSYWVLSLAMFACKSSYLLMVPYLMRQLPADQHARTIGLLSVVVHVVGIAGTAAGGAVLQHLGPQLAHALMAAGDFAQMAVCTWLLRTAHGAPVLDRSVPAPTGRTSAAVWRLAIVLLLFDFSAYLVRPFFTAHWERLSGRDDHTLSALVFAIPAAMALAGLAWQHLAPGRAPRVVPVLLLGAAGLLLQALPSQAALLAGRCLFGWTLFQVVVALETRVFRLSTPASYARDYAVVNACQNLGVLLASATAGLLITHVGMPVVFAIAAAGWLVTATLERPRVPSSLPALETHHAH